MATQNHGKEKKLKDKKLIIYQMVELGQDKDGYPIIEYRPIHPGSLWAYVRQIGGQQYWAAMSHNAKEEMLFVVNWRADLNVSNATTYFIMYRDLWYQVQRFDTYEGYKSDIFIYANNTLWPVDRELIRPYVG